MLVAASGYGCSQTAGEDGMGQNELALLVMPTRRFKDGRERERRGKGTNGK
jgi:hypothetical protein